VVAERQVAVDAPPMCLGLAFGSNFSAEWLNSSKLLVGATSTRGLQRIQFEPKGKITIGERALES